MSFLKITDPSKRDHIVEEFLKSKRNIIQNFRSERLGDIGLQRELTKLYKLEIGKSQLTQQQALSTALTKEHDTIRYDTIEEFNVDWKAEYSALSSTRSQKKKLKQPTPVPL